MLIRNGLAALVAIFTIIGASKVAQAEEMSGGALRELVTNKRVYLAVPLGGEFPLAYKSSGVVVGDGTGLGLGKFLAPKETGRWWVDGRQLCQKWPTWYKGRTTCFKITKTGSRSIRWVRDDGYAGKAQIEG